MLNEDYFFDFAGMPQSGKTQIIENVVQYFRDAGISIGEYDGGSRYSSLHDAPIEDLNFLLACKAAEFIITSSYEKRDHKIYLLDRGVIDRCIFTNTLFRRKIINKNEVLRITSFLTLPRLLKNLSGIFIFTTSPEMALERELKSKIEESTKGINSTRGVMNYSFLLDMQTASKEMYENIKENMKEILPNVQHYDTEEDDEKIEETALKVIRNIESKINSRD